MEYSVRFHEGVTNDIDEAYAFYENRQQGLGEDFLTALRVRTAAIQAAPEHFSFSNRNTYREAGVKVSRS